MESEAKIYSKPGNAQQWNNANSNIISKEPSSLELFIQSQEEAQKEQLMLLSRLESVLHRFKDERQPLEGCCEAMGETSQPDHNTRLVEINRQAIRSNDWLRQLVEKAGAIH